MWVIPESSLFELELEREVYLSACRLVTEDDETLIVDYEGLMGVRLRAQIRKEDIRIVRTQPPLPNAIDVSSLSVERSSQTQYR